MTVPSILDEVLSQCPDTFMKSFAKRDLIAVGGGTMKDTLGQKLHANEVKLPNHFRPTELGALAPIFRPEGNYDWRYLRLRQDLYLSLKAVGTSQEGTDLVVLSGRPFGHRESWELQDRLELNSRNARLEI